MEKQSNALKKQVRSKVENLLSEFAEGKVSREQFHAIYDHYNSQLQLIDQMGDADEEQLTTVPGGTIAIRKATMGKALGLIIYHNKSGTFVDTLGEFDVPPALLSPTLNDFTQLMEAGKLIARRINKLPDHGWLLFAAARMSSLVALFHHEPSAQQVREMERLHHDFEQANQTVLSGTRAIDKGSLAYPFLVFVQSKIQKG
jgi:hypothetical protein